MDEDHFDRLSDDLLRLIFNRVHNANSLCSCLSVSKRFASIIPLTNSVSLVIPRRTIVKQSDDQKTISESDCRGRSLSENFLRILVSKFIVKPLQFIHRVLIRKSFDSDDECSFYKADEVLKSFNEIESLQIQLPSHGGEVGFDGNDTLLRWKAEFGSELKTCVILCATSFQKTEHSSDINISNTKEQNENSEIESSESILRSDELKLRILWTMFCIIASSARHYTLKQVIANQPKLRNILVTDEKKQEKMCMSEEQITEMRIALNSNSSALESVVERTRIPALTMKMRHVRSLELLVSGKVMKGATLIVIRAVDGEKKLGTGNDDDDVDLLEGAFTGDMEEEALSEAVREMVKKKKTFTLEMDSF